MSAARIAGNGNARSLIELWSTPLFSSAARIITSPTPFRAFTAIVLPARSAGVRIELDPLTRMFCQLVAWFVLSTSLSATAEIGMPDVLAIIAGTQPAKPTSMFEFASPSMMSLPLWAVIFLISIPCCSKKPFLMPRSSGSVLAIGSTPTERLTAVACDLAGAPAAPPANSAATRRIAQPAITARPRCLAPVVFIPSPFLFVEPLADERRRSRRRGVVLDEPVDVRALVRELRKLLRRDLVARQGKLHPDHLLHDGRGMG